MSDDSEEDGPEFSGIIQPPLIHQLKSILDQYPDDGQILKEIIQNAEDAEASEMKVLFDERRVNEDNGTKEKAFKKVLPYVFIITQSLLNKIGKEYR